MSLLYDFAWSRIFEITQKDPRELKLILSSKLDYPFFTFREGKKILVLTKPKKKSSSIYSLHGIYYPNSEKGAMADMFAASTYHLAIHVISSKFSAYKNLFDEEDKKRIRFVIRLIEDTIVETYLKIYWPGFRKSIAFANALSFIQLKQDNSFINKDQLLYKSILALRLTGNIKEDLPQKERKAVEEIFRHLTELEDIVTKKCLELKKTSRLASRLKASETNNERLFSARKILRILDNFGSPIDSFSIPYGENWETNNIFKKNFTIDSDFIQAIEGSYKRLNIKIENKFHINYLKKINGEYVKIIDSQEIYDNRLQQIIKQYSRLGKDLNFKNFGIPIEDYSEFIKIRSSLSGPIRRILEDLKRVKERTEESYMEESGSLDLQAAIQVIASKSMRNDIFVREELLDKSESWAILVDASLSLAMCRGDVRSITVALAEVAKNLIGGEDSWGLFAFNDTFQILKDFYEPYNNNIRAKIGGLQHKGLSLLPDAVTIATKSLSRTGEDVKILLLITDGVPTGYSDIEEKFIESIKNAQKSNITPLIIGLGSKDIRKMFRNSCHVQNISDLMKKFVGLYHETHNSL